jgi:hypothetical protein
MSVSSDCIRPVGAGKSVGAVLELLDRLHPMIEEVTAVAEQEAQKWPEVACVH